MIPVVILMAKKQNMTHTVRMTVKHAHTSEVYTHTHSHPLTNPPSYTFTHAHQSSVTTRHTDLCLTVRHTQHGRITPHAVLSAASVQSSGSIAAFSRHHWRLSVPPVSPDCHSFTHHRLTAPQCVTSAARRGRRANALSGRREPSWAISSTAASLNCQG